MPKITYNMSYLLPAKTKTEWNSANPVIPDRLLVADTETHQLKLGDGSTNWNDLPYLNADEIKKVKDEIDQTIQSIQTTLSQKADSGTKLSEYGITDAYTKGETDQKIAAEVAKLSHMTTEVVEKLPEVDAANDHTIYLVAKDAGKPQDGYIEYLLINQNFEIIGNTDIDLTNYITKDGLDAELEKKVDGTTIEFTEGKFKVKEDVLGIQPDDYATADTGGTIKSSDADNKIKIGEDGTGEVNKLSMAKLFIADGDTIVIDGGSAVAV